ncbi:hypothetical protein [Fimbriimonas ginsengisoli]|uniref:Uncharacterized protein n=1 Tax=Fimbriimonas ginsengisoli Gsoil 348 TaxID=661478 RepID=A0A068NQE9_FIMGI|nr:hypothetical protein [Fimbriimonas ginsengisoli]AIE84975.1 hypothetical protein OP10G_1607 [Fimbriimonas ginsengisoli Gsoil 348]
MTMKIGRLRGEPVLNASLDSTTLKRIRMSGQALPIAEGAHVHYRIVSNGVATRIGYLFEFQDGPEPRSVLVGTDALEWLMGDPDCDEPYATLR